MRTCSHKREKVFLVRMLPVVLYLSFPSQDTELADFYSRGGKSLERFKGEHSDDRKGRMPRHAASRSRDRRAVAVESILRNAIPELGKYIFDWIISITKYVLKKHQNGFQMRECYPHYNTGTK